MENGVECGVEDDEGCGKQPLLEDVLYLGIYASNLTLRKFFFSLG